MITRRRFVQGVGVVGLGLLAGCGRWPGQASPAPRVYHLGYLGSDLPAPFRDGLRELGYIEGQNLVVAARDPGIRVERYAALAAELVALPVDVLVTAGAATARGARQATGTIPIVVLGRAGDLLAAGVAVSLAQPGGNVTGLTAVSQSLREKRLQLLQETAPNATRVALLRYPEDILLGSELEDAAATLGLRLQIMTVRDAIDLESALDAILRARSQALFVGASPLMIAHQEEIVEFAARSQLPAMYELPEFVRAGGLMAYLPRVADSARRAAVYVDKILKGANPAELPIEQPMTFDFVINLQTAQALGLTIPQHVLLQATEVIQ